MKTVTLRQPESSLFVVGLKMTITCSWPAPRSLWAWDGSTEELAIHAAARPPRLAECPPAVSWQWVAELPLGAVLATTRLLDCGLVVGHDGINEALLAVPDPGERAEDVPRRRWVSCEMDAYGDFSVGRWVWRPLGRHELEPCPAKGRPRIWDWTP